MMSVTLRGNRGRRLFVVMIAACVIASVGIVQAAPITIPVNCGQPAVHVGDVTVDVSGGGVAGGFSSIVGTPPSLAAAAAACNEDHFNWYQVVTADNMPPNDAGGNPVVPPYVDVPPGGYGPPSTQWGDNLPWYWDEGADPPAGTPGFSDGFNIADHLQDINPADGTIETLHYEDFPGGAAGTNLSFKTWLVSLNADGSFHSWHGGFSWDWSNSTGGDVASNLAAFEGAPTAAEYTDIIGGFVPEPSALSLLAFVGMVFIRRRR